MNYRYVESELILAQELQKAGEYEHSRQMYKKFYGKYPKHPMRFKALFEVADNLYYEKKYKEALKSYDKFFKYCDEQDNVTAEEISWIKAYGNLAYSRIKAIRKIYFI